MSVELSIIIVNWNGIKFLPECLKSIIDNPPVVSYEIVVIDNASSDNSIDWLNSKEGKDSLKNTNFKLIESKENIGFGRANNLGIKQTNTPYVFLLNPDTIVKPNSINNLLKTLQSDKKIGLVAPKLLNSDQSLQTNAWAIPSATRILIEGLKIYKIIPQKIRRKWLLSGSLKYDEKRDVPLVSGAAMMVKRDLINQVGVFDQNLFMYGEDVEWCVRIGRGGWRIISDPGAEIVHLGGQSSIQMWGKNDTRMKEEEAFLRFQQDCFTPFQVLKNTFARTLILSIYYVFSLLRNKQDNNIKEVILLQLKGFNNSVSQIILSNRTRVE